MKHTIRQNLAAAYRITHLMGYDDLTYTHLSARAEDGKSFYILPFGFLFDEVTASSLLRVDFDGNVLEGSEFQYNRTGYVIHGTIYQGRPDVNSVFHVHTHETIAVSAMKEGLLPISQWALHFYGMVGYHDYNSLSLSLEEHSDPLVRDLADHNVLFLRNHGVITCGKTIHAAYIYLHHLQQACKTQCLAMADRENLILPSKEICERSVKDLLSFEPDIGYRDWQALLRLLRRRDCDYEK